MPAELSGRLAALFRWIDPGPGATHLVSDVSGWWRDPEVLARLGPALVEPFRAARPTVVVSPAVTGYCSVRSPRRRSASASCRPTSRATVGCPPGRSPGRRARRTSGADGSTWPCGTTACKGGDRVLVVDDWVATGAQVRALYEICAARGAEPVGTATVVLDCPPASPPSCGYGGSWTGRISRLDLNLG